MTEVQRQLQDVWLLQGHVRRSWLEHWPLLPWRGKLFLATPVGGTAREGSQLQLLSIQKKNTYSQVSDWILKFNSNTTKICFLRASTKFNLDLCWSTANMLDYPICITSSLILHPIFRGASLSSAFDCVLESGGRVEQHSTVYPNTICISNSPLGHFWREELRLRLQQQLPSLCPIFLFSYNDCRGKKSTTQPYGMPYCLELYLIWGKRHD